MRRRHGFLLAGCAVLMAPPLSAQDGWSALQRAVASAERAFAQSMADRNFDAFVSHLAAEAVFFGGGDQVLRGREAVAGGWRRYFEATEAPFSWEPTQVEVLSSGTLALSSGPVRTPDGTRVGTFNSIWRLEADGRWRVIFDKGCPP